MDLERENQFFEHEPLAQPHEREEYEFRCSYCGGMEKHDPSCPVVEFAARAGATIELPGFPSAAVPPPPGAA